MNLIRLGTADLGGDISVYSCAGSVAAVPPVHVPAVPWFEWLLDTMNNTKYFADLFI